MIAQNSWSTISFSQEGIIDIFLNLVFEPCGFWFPWFSFPFCSRNQLSTLPAHLCRLPLKVLIACNNKLVSLPEDLGKLRQLTELVCVDQLSLLSSEIYLHIFSHSRTLLINFFSVFSRTSAVMRSRHFLHRSVSWKLYVTSISAETTSFACLLVRNTCTCTWMKWVIFLMHCVISVLIGLQSWLSCPWSGSIFPATR